MGYRSTTIYRADDAVVGYQNALGFIYSTVLDAASRPVASINPLGYYTTTVFDAASQSIATIDANSAYATSIFSPNGSLIASQNQLGYLTSFILDAASQRICVVDANNGRSTTIFSNRGLVLAEQDQLGALTSYTQDGNGNNILRVDARQWPTSYTMDPLNRMAGAQFIDGTRWTNTWDQSGQPLVNADVTGIYTSIWDLDSRKLATQNPTGINLTSTLDSVGNRLVLQDNYRVSSYIWDSQSRLVGIWNPINERTTMSYDVLDREYYRVMANSRTTSHVWDSNVRETVLGNYGPTGVGLAIFTNSYSPTDNRLTVAEIDGTQCTFGYDFNSQIITEARSGTYAYNRSYVFDPLGNRIQQYDSGALTTGQFNKANELTLLTPPTGAPTTSSYDANGNLTLENSGGVLTTLSWSPENKLLSYATASGTETYQNGQDGLRRQKTNSSGTTNFTIDDPNVLLETTPSGVLVARYTQSPEGYGGLASQNQSGTSSFHGFDSQMASRILVSVSGLVTDNYSFKAFGEELQSGSGTTNPHRYGGQVGYYRDAVNIMQIGQRKLLAAIGRWASRDPLGFGGGDRNLYRYVDNSALNNLDPTGLLKATPYDQINSWIIGDCPPPISVDDGCHPGECGEAQAFWKYTTTTKCNPNFGFMIQSVRFGGQETNCDNSLRINYDTGQKDFFEAFLLDNRNPGLGFVLDRSQTGPLNPGKKVNFSANRVAKFYCASKFKNNSITSNPGWKRDPTYPNFWVWKGSKSAPPEWKWTPSDPVSAPTDIKVNSCCCDPRCTSSSRAHPDGSCAFD